MSPEPGGEEAPTGTLVEVAVVERRTIEDVVTAPGRTAALREAHVRAPFGGTLASVSVVVGSTVRSGQTMALLRSSDAVAAEAGAAAILTQAKTDAQIAEAQRAIVLAKAADISWTVAAPESGTVLAVAASQGDRLSEGDDILTLSPSGSIYFRAQLSQRDVSRIGSSAAVKVHLTSVGDELAATVHGVLPATDNDALDVPLRVDFASPLEPPVIGLFGEAHIAVGEHPDVLVVPTNAVLTDDIEGSHQIARVGNDWKAHWLPVQVGGREGDDVEVTCKGLLAGDKVIVAGQVGLPDGTSVRVAP